MYITYEKYKSFGYDYVSEEEFDRYCAVACSVADFLTSSRLAEYEIDDKISRGLCEIADLLKKRREDDTGNLSGFSNEGYSESYQPGGAAELYAAIYAVMTVWFDNALLSRGI